MDDPSPLVPDYEDLEAAREAETNRVGAPQPRGNGRRWLAVAVLAIIGAVVFALAWCLSGQVPAEGDASAEARVTALVTMGATAGAAAVSLAAVVLTIGLQREQEQQQRWADFQVEMLSEAFDWIDGVYSRFGQVVGAVQEWGYAGDREQASRLAQATRLLQEFYDHGQRLGEIDRLERLVADREVRAALRQADGALRQFNEVAAGDHTTREVRVAELGGSEWQLLEALGDAQQRIRNAYASAVQTAYQGG
jgi:hypothetical protein